MKKISANIKFLRKNKGLTQEQFATEIGIKRSMVGAYEEDRASPKMENIKEIANFFGISVDELVSERITAKWLEEKAKRVQNETELKAGNLRVLSITVDSDNNENIELVFEIICQCIDSIYDSNEVYSTKEQTPKEVREFVDNLTQQQFGKLQQFFDTLPKLEETVKYACPICKKDHEQVIKGLESFF